MSKSYKIGVIRGDGIGPEIIDEAIKVLDAVSVTQGFNLKYEEMLLGGAAIDETGVRDGNICKPQTGNGI